MEQEPLFDLGPDWRGFDRDLRSSLGNRGACGETQGLSFEVAGARPERIVFPDSVHQVQELVKAIGKRGLCVVPLGLGAHAALAGPPHQSFVALSLSGLDRIVDFQPANMTLTIEAGATLERLQATAARAGQWLPLDPPLEDRTTVGGLIAANLSGPARFSQGTVRDLLIGINVVNADGRIVHGGGRVVKNVAGYDLPKLYCGSEGTLGVIVEGTFKLRPRPEEFRILQVQCATAHRTQELLTRLIDSGLDLSFVELLGFVPPGDVGYNIIAGCLGASLDAAYLAGEVRGILGNQEPVQELSGAEAMKAATELRNFRVSGKPALRVKASLLPTKVMPFVRKLENEGNKNALRIALSAHAGNGIVYAGIQQARTLADAELVERLASAAKELGGSLRLVEGPAELRRQVNLASGSAPGNSLMKKIKEKLDPGNILSPGRLP